MGGIGKPRKLVSMFMAFLLIALTTYAPSVKAQENKDNHGYLSDWTF